MVKSNQIKICPNALRPSTKKEAKTCNQKGLVIKVHYIPLGAGPFCVSNATRNIFTCGLRGVIVDVPLPCYNILCYCSVDVIIWLQMGYEVVKFYLPARQVSC